MAGYTPEQRKKLSDQLQGGLNKELKKIQSTISKIDWDDLEDTTLLQQAVELWYSSARDILTALNSDMERKQNLVG